MVLIARGHYTIDVLVAYYVTTRLFWMYHTVACNPSLRVSLDILMFFLINCLVRILMFRFLMVCFCV